jgi:hypothetical protein
MTLSDTDEKSAIEKVLMFDSIYTVWDKTINLYNPSDITKSFSKFIAANISQALI